MTARKDKAQQPVGGDEAAPREEKVQEEPTPEAAVEEGAEIERLRNEVAELNDRILRMAADFENRSKRLEREKSQALEYADESILKDILPFIDNLERALSQDTENENALLLMMEGVNMTLEGLLAALGRRGLKPIESLGCQFDPNLHEAMAMQPGGDDTPAQTVLEEYEKGYLLKERLLRPAKVVVAAG